MIGNRQVIAVCVSRIQDEATNEYITALKEAATREGYYVFVYNTCSVISVEESAQTSVYDLMDYEIIDSVVVFEEVIQNETVSRMLIEKSLKHKVPVVVIGERHEGCVNIQFDHENGFARMVRHMVCEHHLTRLHLMAGTKGNPFSDQRLEAFKEVLEENQLPFDDSMVSYGEFWSGPTEQATRSLIASGNLPQAIICGNDKMAITVCGVLAEYGIRVPEEVAVTGFDGIQEVKFSTPRITTVVCDYADLADQTIRTLNEWENYKDGTHTLKVPLRICLGESCGCRGEKTLSASEFFNVVSDRFYRFQDEDITLSQITARVQRCENVEQVAEQLKHKVLYDISCVLEADCLDETVNPFQQESRKLAADRDMVVLFESDVAETFIPYKFSLKKIFPQLEEMLGEERMVIFTSLYQVDVPIGYVCFYFRELIHSNYVKVPQTVNALNNAIGGYRNVRYRQYLMHQIDEMYRQDMLTGLRNRRGFDIEYQQLLAGKSPEQQWTIMMTDLDGLKYINDNFGHKEGDLAIYTVARAFQEVCPQESLLTRFGGDEMLAVYPGVLEVDVIKTRFYEYLDQFNETSQKEYYVQASIGVYYTEPEDDLSFEGIIEKADIFMYMEKAKRKKNRIR